MILYDKLKVINIGIKVFADDLYRQQVEIVHVKWRPPAGGETEIVDILKRLEYGESEQKK